MLKEISISLLLLFTIQASDSICQDYYGRIDRLMTAYYNNGVFNGAVLAAKNGQLVYEKAFGYADREWNVQNTVGTKFRIASLSKAFTALLILQLAEEGKIDLNGTIRKYIPDYKGRAGDTITIHQLLTHTSGIATGLEPEDEAIQERLHHSLREMVGYAETASLCFKPGTDYRYSNLGYNILAYIVEQVTAKSFGKALKERVLEPAGMDNTSQAENNRIETMLARGYEYKLLYGYEKASPFDDSYTTGPGGIISTVNDLYSFNQILCSEILLGKNYKSLMFKPYGKGNYGYGWFISKRKLSQEGDSVPVADHSGSINGFGAYMARIEHDSVFVVVLKNQRTDSYLSPAFAPEIGSQIISILYGKQIDPPRESVANHIASFIGSQGIDSAVSEYYRILKDEPDRYCLEEPELNRLGIELFFRFKMLDEALKIFAINMLQFPESYNVYDSYAYVLMMKGDYINAITYYKKGLEILKKYPLENDTETVGNESAKAKEYIKEMEKKLGN